MSETIGDQFQEQTKYDPNKMPYVQLDWENQPNPYKTYPKATQIALPVPERQSGPGLWQTIQNRRSQRSFNQQPLTLVEISQLLWSCQGVSAQRNKYLFRTAPSAGALYPIETYVAVQNVSGLSAAIYHYHVVEHGLELINPGNMAQPLAKAAMGQQMISLAPVTFIWTAIFERSKWKYRQRAYRYIYLDAGHIAGNLALAAVGLGLGSCQIAALFDDEVNQLLEVDGKRESVVYMSVVGRI